MRMIISAGGSLGHINPALAIIRKFQEKECNLEVLYIGTHNRMEKELIPKENIPYHEIEIYGFTKNMKRNIKNIPCIYFAYHECLNIMKKFQPDIVIGVGGYVTYPVLKAAHKLHIKTFLHEQNSIPGKSNKVLAKYADLIGVTFQHSKHYFKTKGRIVWTGHPSGAQALKEPRVEKTTYGLSKTKKLVLVVAGSLGSGSLNQKMKNFLRSLTQVSYELLYVTGNSHYEEFIKGEVFPKNVKIVPYVEHLAGLMKQADVVISRAGSASLYELIALQIPSIIIPSPNVANNHQYYNAKEMSDLGAIKMLEEQNITTELLQQEVKELLEHSDSRRNILQNMKKLTILDSSEMIYQEIKDLIQ
ncbi:MAG: undecaprenyldiphospho-muramoylpentapeptide beta-N-acetylglucosaminyltransferase [Bacilli bacterium]|jgi:UDP-N-acetylglucosamine--N-acetylmuramyl-(pentapeptide) pyrophosphoryl-undecaprenol N-acetylglucosamine transferase|nr:undecaprenyldiphospho-muramoylpentapeptide beta-N-acetylglucosaminyltransferase [Bacilli bacterium]